MLTRSRGWGREKVTANNSVLDHFEKKGVERSGHRTGQRRQLHVEALMQDVGGLVGTGVVPALLA